MFSKVYFPYALLNDTILSYIPSIIHNPSSSVFVCAFKTYENRWKTVVRTEKDSNEKAQAMGINRS